MACSSSCILGCFRQLILFGYPHTMRTSWFRLLHGNSVWIGYVTQKRPAPVSPHQNPIISHAKTFKQPISEISKWIYYPEVERTDRDKSRFIFCAWLSAHIYRCSLAEQKPMDSGKFSITPSSSPLRSIQIMGWYSWSLKRTNVTMFFLYES